MEEISFETLLARVRVGDEDAVKILVDRYQSAIKREVRFSLLDQRLKRVLDESDVCQSVMYRFLLALWAGRYDIDKPEQLVGLLKEMVRHRVVDLARHWRSQKRDLRRDAAPPDGSGTGIDPADAQPSPSRIVSEEEMFGEVRRRLGPTEMRIFELRRAGKQWPEIAAELGGQTGPEALRKRYERALAAIADEMAPEQTS